MAVEVARLEAVLSAKTDSFRREMDQAESRMGKAKTGIHKSAMAIGAAIGTGLGVVAKVGWDEFKQGALVTAQTNAVLKSTGGVANVTAKQVDSLAESLMKKSGVDDEAIKSGQNMLLTFTNIRNETGRGNDIFNQATKTVLDFSVATGKDMVQSSVLVGKALNDPIKGVTALSRVGVTFSDKQKAMIARLVETGQKAKAQKVVLRELNREFGGSAEAAGKTLPGQLNILKESFSNFAGELVAGAIPKLKAVVDLIREHSGLAKIAAGIIIGLATSVMLVSAALKVYRAGVIVATAAQWLWNAAMTANPIGLVVLALVALGVGLVVAWKKSETFRKIVTGAFDGVKRIASGVFNWIKRNWPLLLSIIAGPIGLAVGLVIRHWGAIKEKTAQIWNWIRDKVTGAINRVRDVFPLVRNTAMFTWDFVRDKAQVVIDVVKSIIQKLRDMVAYIKSIPGRIKGALGRVGGFFGNLIGDVGGAIGDIRAIDFSPSRAMRGVDSRLFGALGLAQQMGLAVSSTFRPGARVAGSGARSDHSYYPSKAVDFSGSGSAMLRFANAVTRLSGIDTVIYSPRGLWKAGSGWGGITSAITRRDHYDHVHVDTFDRAGLHWLKPGWTMAGNFTGRPEPIVAGGRAGLGNNITVNINGPVYGADARQLAEKIAQPLRNVAAQFQRANGRPMFSG